jgi:hypothetical protein
MLKRYERQESEGQIGLRMKDKEIILLIAGCNEDRAAVAPSLNVKRTVIAARMTITCLLRTMIIAIAGSAGISLFHSCFKNDHT